MKTIFITSFHGIISRNILSTPFLTFALARNNTHIVILCPTHKKKFFEAEFSRPGITIQPVDVVISKVDQFLRYLSLASLRTDTLHIKRHTELQGSGLYSSYLLGNKLGITLVRFLSKHLTSREVFDTLIKDMNPSIIFSTDIQNEYDVRVMHAGKDQGVHTVSMVRSWDNLTSKGIVRCVPDRFLVTNEVVRSEAITLQGIPEEKITIVGIPHYDAYVTGKRSSRQDFFTRIVGNQKKKLALFVPTGDRYLSSNTVDADLLKDVDAALPSDFQILVRLPPSDRVRAFEAMKSTERILFDTPSTAFVNIKETELGGKEDAHLADTLFYSDIIITGPSTMCIDAAVFDKPIILLGYDGPTERPYFESIRRFYDYDHFKPVLGSGGVHYVESKEDLNAAIRAYIETPSLDREGRKVLVKKECFALDGKSSERLASALLQPE